ncbi:GtrA family protein [Alphaproteobacteria bacterium LSUCC0719]
MSFLSRFVKFGLIGVGVTAIHVVVAATLVESSMAAPSTANGIAFIIAATVSFMVNARITFGAKLEVRSFIRFLSVTGACGGLSAAIAAVADAQGLDYRIGIVAVVATIPVLSFLLHNFWSFRQLK